MGGRVGADRGASLTTLTGTDTQHSIPTVPHPDHPNVVAAPGAGALAEPIRRAGAR